MRPAPNLTSEKHPRPTTGAERLFGKLFFLIPLGVIGNVLFCLMAVDRETFHAALRVKPGYLAVALLLSIVPWFTGSLRLFLWGKFLGGKIRYRDIFKIVLGAELGAAVSPPFIGGCPVKIGLLMKREFSAGTAFSLTLLENFEDALFFLVMVPVTLTLSSAWNLPVVKNGLSALRHAHFWLPAAGIAVAVLSAFFLLLFQSEGINRLFPAVRSITVRLISSYRNFIGTYHAIIRTGKKFFALTMTLTTVQWLCRYSIISLLLMGLGIPSQPLLFMALQVVVFALVAFIPSPGGTGGAEAIFYLTYRSLLPADAIVIVTAGWRFLTFYFLLFLASILLLVLNRRTTAEQMMKMERFSPDNDTLTMRGSGYFPGESNAD